MAIGRWFPVYAGLLLLAGCSDRATRPVTAILAPPPSAVRFTGVVRYPHGDPVNTAWVHVGQIAGTLSDTSGVYTLDCPTATDTMTLAASDGHAPGGMYAEIHSGSVQVVVDRKLVRADIVLDHVFP